jgi:hypothetical protein
MGGQRADKRQHQHRHQQRGATLGCGGGSWLPCQRTSASALFAER